jgi:hypothetical protein
MPDIAGKRKPALQSLARHLQYSIVRSLAQPQSVPSFGSAHTLPRLKFILFHHDAVHLSWLLQAMKRTAYAPERCHAHRLTAQDARQGGRIRFGQAMRRTNGG